MQPKREFRVDDHNLTDCAKAPYAALHSRRGAPGRSDRPPCLGPMGRDGRQPRDRTDGVEAPPGAHVVRRDRHQLRRGQPAFFETRVLDGIDELDCLEASPGRKPLAGIRLCAPMGRLGRRRLGRRRTHAGQAVGRRRTSGRRSCSASSAPARRIARASSTISITMVAAGCTLHTRPTHRPAQSDAAGEPGNAGAVKG